MSQIIKSQKSILEKLGIDTLNAMQKDAHQACKEHSEIVLLSPTGTGKTLAFLLPIVSQLDRSLEEVQAMIIAPSRELAIQIEQVAREMGTGLKINVIYGGGQSFSKDKIDLKHPPALLIGTPGRIADHIHRGTFAVRFIKTLVLDEFDKSLEVGFEGEMKDIVFALSGLEKKILTSATRGLLYPLFLGLREPFTIDYLADKISQLQIKKVVSPSKDKLQTLFETICHIAGQPTIIFCNYKDTIHRLSEFLKSKEIHHGCFYGGMEQLEREQSLIQFRNGSSHLLLATDLAARGIDVPEIKYIIHYHLPPKEEEFTHRNGRTARMYTDGTAFILTYNGEKLPDYIGNVEEETLDSKELPILSNWRTLQLSVGRKDKISKGDLAGFFFKVGQLEKDQVGNIELKQEVSYVAVNVSDIHTLITQLDNQKIKNVKSRIHLI